MDTALFTFMVQTAPYTQSVSLIGSWDNFSKHYHMERDSKRARGQWRGCHAFTDIICDGDGANRTKRTGGLRMGSTYYYYYELDNGSEVHDPSVPFTTACPYLPGQPVNLLSVPIEIHPSRDRSASLSSMANQDLMTMNPADKFVAPRPPPPPPSMSLRHRATTAPTLPPPRSARSVSPRADKWSPRSFFGLRSPSYDHDSRGRSSSESSKSAPRSISIASTTSNRKTSIVEIRDVSPQPPRRSPRAISPPRSLQRKRSSTLMVPDEMVDDAEDDDNFASQSNLGALYDRGIFTQLSPPPSSLRSSPARTPPMLSPITIGSFKSSSRSNSISKPLPELPEESVSPQSIHMPTIVAVAEIPRSHFSVSTISTSVGSPSESSFAFNISSTPETNEEEDLVADSESGDELAYSPITDQSDGQAFTGYSLPEDQYSSEQTLQKDASYTQITPRTTFGGAPNISSRAETDLGNMSALEELLSEVGYLGDFIVGK